MIIILREVLRRLAEICRGCNFSPEKRSNKKHNIYIYTPVCVYIYIYIYIYIHIAEVLLGISLLKNVQPICGDIIGNSPPEKWSTNMRRYYWEFREPGFSSGWTLSP